jgi:hypothetical protein
MILILHSEANRYFNLLFHLWAEFFSLLLQKESQRSLTNAISVSVDSQAMVVEQSIINPSYYQFQNSSIVCSG